jgi:hypothetical protein
VVKALIGLLLFYFSLGAWAANLREVPGKRIYFDMHSGENGFEIQTVLENPRRLPRLLSTSFYRSRAVAQVDFVKLGRRHSESVIPRVAMEVPGQSLWPVTQAWSVQWETKYRQWIEREVDEEFMNKNSIATDCADVALVFRWVFSRINGLPAANRLAGTGQLFTQDSLMEEWLELPTNPDWRMDKRFLAALDYILEMTYTHSLILDSYPIAINSAVLNPGAIFLYLFGDEGHTLFVHRLTDGRAGEAPLRTLSSTVPKDVRTLFDSEFTDSTQPETAGFIRPRWPEKDAQGLWRLRPRDQMPLYSLEQYDPEATAGIDFQTFVFDRVAPNRKVDLAMQFEDLITQLETLFNFRVDYVNQGNAACYPNLCPPNSQAYRDWSTPARDQRIADRIATAKRFVARQPEFRGEWNQYLSSVYIMVEDQGQSLELTLDDLINTWAARRYSSDPNDAIFKRWGVSTYVQPITTPSP